MTTLINVKTLIYLWTRDAGMPVNKETEDYIIQHIEKLGKVAVAKFSDTARLEMVERILEAI